MFAADRDLLVLEPSLFADSRFASQRVMSGRCNVQGTVLALEEFDVDFEEAQVQAGGVVVVEGVSFEVLGRLNAKKLEISRVKPAGAGAIPGGKRAGACWVCSFAVQREVVGGLMLQLAGLSAADAGVVMNRCELVHAHGLGTMALAHYAGAAGLGNEHPLVQRAAQYQLRFDRACERLSIVLDTDGDGIADSSRRMAGGTMVRA